MNHSFIDTQLDLIEQQLCELADVLLNGSPQTVQAASAALQQLAVRFMQMVDEAGRFGLLDRSRMHRIQVYSNALQPLREGLLRQSAYVERALEVVMPAAQSATYVAGTRFGGAMRPSGAFKALSA